MLWLFKIKFRGFVGFLSMVIYVVSLLYTQCLRYNICSAWFLDIRISTCFSFWVSFMLLIMCNTVCSLLVWCPDCHISSKHAKWQLRLSDDYNIKKSNIFDNVNFLFIIAAGWYPSVYTLVFTCAVVCDPSSWVSSLAYVSLL